MRPVLTSLFITVGLLTNCIAPALLAVATLPLTGWAADKEKVEVLRVTPSGEDVPAGREIVIQFDRQMVPLGRMERRGDEVPVEIEPKLQCQWRWISSDTLSCQLDERDALQVATRYQVKIRPGIKALDGAVLDSPAPQSGGLYEFVTVRPKVSWSYFHTWSSPSLPVFNVVFNQEIEPASLERHLYFTVRDGNSSTRRVSSSVSPVKEYSGRGFSVTPAEELPVGAAAALLIEPGLQSKIGTAAGVEERSLEEFATIAAPRIVGVRCSAVRKRGVELAGEDSEEAQHGEESEGPDTDAEAAGRNTAIEILSPVGGGQRRCNPMAPIYLLTTSPLLVADVKQGITFEPPLGQPGTAGQSVAPEESAKAWESVEDSSRRTTIHRLGEFYELQLPGPLRADQPYTVRAAAGSIKDEFGRVIDEPLELRFATDHRPVRMQLINRISVLEKETDSQLPVVVTNVNALHLKYDAWSAAGLRQNISRSWETYPARNIAYYFPIDVRGLLSGASGVVQGFIEAESGSDRASTWFYSQVTPFSVHAKVGHYNSLIWVNEFASGAPVSGADISIFKGSLNDLATREELTESVRTDADGIARLAGSSVIDPKLELLNQWNSAQPRLFALVRKGDEIAVLPMSPDFEVSAENSYSYSRPRYGHMEAWGTTAQGIYRTGDNMQFKIIVRNQSVTGFIAPPRERYTLRISDPTGTQVAEFANLKLNEFGSYAGTVTVGKSWAVGWYSFVLTASFTDQSWYPLRVLVSDFTPSPFRVANEVNGASFRAGAEVRVNTEATLHAGGPYADAPLRVVAGITPGTLHFEKPELANFDFSAYGQREHEAQLFSAELTVDDKGRNETTFTARQDDIAYGAVTVESAVRDDRGKSVASTVGFDFFGRDRYVGVKQLPWTVQVGTRAAVESIVVDAAGVIVKGSPFAVDVEYEETVAARVKGPGNAFLTEYTQEYRTLRHCDLVAAEAAVRCEFTPDQPGTYRVTATVRDSEGRQHQVRQFTWAIGAGFVLWNSGNTNNLKVIAEKQTYRVGDTARFLVQNPFPGARALISVERFGALRHWSKVLAQSTEVIEVPIVADYLPGFYLSVVVNSPRVEKPAEEMRVDLGKPAFRIGYAEVRLEDDAKELTVAVKTDRPLYRPRETVKLDLQLLSPLPRGEAVEFAVAVLDESVFDLIQGGLNYFDPYAGFYQLKSLDLNNYNLIRALVGRQKFEKKGANPGGSGGRDSEFRSNFKFVSYWNPSIVADRDGHAQIEFSVPDNLTGWRVLALALTKNDRMGVSDGNFKVNQPTEIRPALPNLVRDGDTFIAEFTVMNRTDSARTVEVSASATGSLAENITVRETLPLAPFKRGVVRLPLVAKGTGEVVVRLNAGDAVDRDAIEARVPVRETAVVVHAVAYGSAADDPFTQPIAVPKETRPDTALLTLSASPTAFGDLTGAFRYMREYPYSCWEQRISKGTMAALSETLRAYRSAKFSWPDASTLANETLAEAINFQAPNGGMAFYQPREELSSPYLSAFTAWAFHWFATHGYTVPQAVSDKLDGYLLEILKKKRFPEFYSGREQSTVRALALAALAVRNKIKLAEVRRLSGKIAEMDLFGNAFYLIALHALHAPESELKPVVDRILAHGNETGGKIVFNEQDGYGKAALLGSAARTNCALLSGLLKVRKGGDPLLLKVVRGIAEQRGRSDNWGSTQDNLFCVMALGEFAATSGGSKIAMNFDAVLDGNAFAAGTFNKIVGEPLLFDTSIPPDRFGMQSMLTVRRQGKGRLFLSADLGFSPLASDLPAENAGIQVARQYSVERDGRWLLVDPMTVIRRGELLRVDLFVSLPGSRSYVVVDDPIPAGLEPVNRDLATASKVDSAKAETDLPSGSIWHEKPGWLAFGEGLWTFYHRELRHEAARFYSEQLPPGNYHLAYTAQAIASGSFQALPVLAQEMYHKDTYGRGLSTLLRIAGDD